MKKLLMLLVLLGLGFAAGNIYWQRQAKLIERDLAGAIERFNAETKAHTGITPIEHQGMALSGFPFAITLTLDRPVLRLPLSHWIATPTPGTNWVEEHRFQGPVSLSADWKVTRYQLQLPSQVESQSVINGKPYFVRKSSAESPLTCSLALNMIEAFDKLWQPMETLKRALADLSLLRDLSCAVAGYRLATGEHVFHTLKQGRFTLGLETGEAKDVVTLSLNASVEDYQAHPLNDQFYHHLFAAFPELNRRTRKGLVSLDAFSQYGAQKIALDARYAGPLQTPDWNTPFALDVPHLEIQNALYSLKAKVTAAVAPPKENLSDLAFDIDATGSLTETYEKMARDRFAEELRTSRGRVGVGSFFVDTKQLSPENFHGFVEEFFPQLAEVSPLHLQAKGTARYRPPANGEWLPSPLEVALKKATLKNAEWQMALEGKGSYARERLLPELDATLKVKNGDLFFAHAANKLIAMERWRQLQAKRAPVLITQDYLNDLRRFTDAVARGQQESPSAEIPTLGDPQFHVVLKNMLPSVNGMNINTLLMLFNELLMPHFTNDPAPPGKPDETYQSIRPRGR